MAKWLKGRTENTARRFYHFANIIDIHQVSRALPEEARQISVSKAFAERRMRR